MARRRGSAAHGPLTINIEQASGTHVAVKTPTTVLIYAGGYLDFAECARPLSRVLIWDMRWTWRGIRRT
jgi:hypothetical protein